MKLRHIIFLLFYIQVTMPLKHKNNKENLPSIFKKPLYINTGLKIHPTLLQVRRQIPIQAATRKEYRKAAPLINISDKGKDILSNLIFRIQGKESPRPSARRSFKRNRRRYSSVEDTSSSEEMAAWKVGYDEDWLRLKKEAILVKKNNSHHGDAIFMMAARPWTSPCGDPQQHDWVWGTCTLSTQCAAEYRIYRGDVYCGRSPLVCCAVQYTAHDLYQGLDRSFEYTDSSSSTEKKKNNIDTVGLRQKKKYRERVRRWRRKRRIKRVIKRKIRSLVHELRKTLNRAFRNASNDRSRKVEALIAQIKSNKYKFRHERNVAKKNFETVADNIHASLYNKLIQLQSVNAHFFLNETFREYLKRFNITGSYLRLLHSVNPKLLAYLSEKPKLAERLGQMLSESPIKSSIDLPNETNQAIQPLTTLKVKDMKKILRQSDPISYDIGEIQNLSSIQDSNLLSNASLEVENTPPAEAVVTESITPFQNSTPLAEMNTDEPNYNDMEKTTPKDVNYDTRRFGSFIFERKKHKKKPKRKDYVEYDIEYGILNL